MGKDCSNDSNTKERKDKYTQSNTETIKQRYIFITGGVLSSLGKGLVAASTGCILKELGFSVN